MATGREPWSPPGVVDRDGISKTGGVMTTNRSTPVASSASMRSFECISAGVVAIVLVDLALAGTAQAYVGPGAGLTAIGTVVALLAAVSLAVVGFIWYPIRRLRRRRRSEDTEQVNSGAGKPS